jgi:hypothetical protein
VWQTVISARRVESLPLLQEAIQAAEVLLGIAGEEEEAQRDPPGPQVGQRSHSKFIPSGKAGQDHKAVYAESGMSIYSASV